MILSKEEREKLQKTIRTEIRAIEDPHLIGLLSIILALISDIEELESIISKICIAASSEKEVSKVLDCLIDIFSQELIEKLHLENQLQLISNLGLLANNALNLKLMLAEMYDTKRDIVQ